MLQAKRSEKTISSVPVVHAGDARDAVGEPQRRLEGFGEAQAHVVLDLEAVDDRVDVCFLRRSSFGGSSSS